MNNLIERTLKLNELCQKKKEYELMKREIEQEIKSINEEIKTEMKRMDKREIYTTDYFIKLQNVKRNTFNTKKFKTEHPELYILYVKQSESERLDVK